MTQSISSSSISERIPPEFSLPPLTVSKNLFSSVSVIYSSSVNYSSADGAKKIEEKDEVCMTRGSIKNFEHMTSYKLEGRCFFISSPKRTFELYIPKDGSKKVTQSHLYSDNAAFHPEVTRIDTYPDLDALVAKGDQALATLYTVLPIRALLTLVAQYLSPSSAFSILVDPEKAQEQMTQINTLHSPRKRNFEQI